jgi:hypothetical protein
MSKYDDLRKYFDKSPNEKVQLLRQELSLPFDMLQSTVNHLTQLDVNTTPSLTGGRYYELLLVLVASTERLSGIIGMISILIRERKQSGGNFDQDDMDNLRIEMLVPIQSLQMAASLLNTVYTDKEQDLPGDFHIRTSSLIQSVNNLRDIVNALTDPQERTSTTAP